MRGEEVDEVIVDGALLLNTGRGNREDALDEAGSRRALGSEGAVAPQDGGPNRTLCGTSRRLLRYRPESAVSAASNRGPKRPRGTLGGRRAEVTWPQAHCREKQRCSVTSARISGSSAT